MAPARGERFPARPIRLQRRHFKPVFEISHPVIAIHANRIVEMQRVLTILAFEKFHGAPSSQTRQWPERLSAPAIVRLMELLFDRYFFFACDAACSLAA